MTIDRKELIRQYKQTARVMGVGAVRNSTNGKVLVVASPDVPSLLNRNQAQLRLNAHASRALQADWNATGPDAFEFVVLDTLTPKESPDYDPTEDLRTLEDLWCGKLNAYEPAGYNRRRAAS